MHKTFKIQMVMQFGENTRKTKKSHKGVKTKSFPNYIKESNQHKIDSKVQQDQMEPQESRKTMGVKSNTFLVER
jgi:hypothetical protein